MTEFLSKIFIKNHNEINDPSVRKKYGTLSSVVGVIVNFILAGMKILIGLLASSVAIIADGLNNLSDAGSSIITFVSFKISMKPADRDHPFGHARMEYIASMIVSFLILLVGTELLIDSGKTLLGLKDSSETVMSITPITFIILSVSILLKLWLGLFYNKIGKKIDSGVIRATATDSITDSISTIAVLISSVIIKFTEWYILDAIVGIGVSVIIIVAGAKILIETKDKLLGEAPIAETVDNIKSIVAQYPDVIGMHDLIVHNYGPHNFIASFHAEVDGKTDIYYLHDVIDNLERHIKNDLSIDCTIHMDPIVTDDTEINELKEFLLSTLEEVGLELSVHDFRVVIGNTHTNLIFDVVVPFEYIMSPSEVKEKIMLAISERRNNCYCVITVDRG